MNFQITLSTNSVSSSTNGADQHGDAANIKGQLLQSVRNKTELNKLEKQGVQVSLADEQLIRAIDKAVKALEGPSTVLEMSVHEKTNQIMVKVLNKDTGELIREIPPEKTLDLVAKMMEITGIIIDQKA
ncbi:flagellar protein FlaG [Paenibacillus cellulositrophicus]|uniref:flagellar protein FlaG n=1 Tax=Paenibacillus cellulositrophicus TaxID=562959 RepID=UPI003F7E8297